MFFLIWLNFLLLSRTNKFAALS
jgi:hypothetical protein